eukprot:scaffold46561_cov60-Phaeocystis_antarctica.AAC.1
MELNRFEPTKYLWLGASTLALSWPPGHRRGRTGIRARVGVMHADALVPSSFSRYSLQLWFSPWRTLVSSSVEMLVLPVPYGAKNSSGAASRR